MRTLTHDEILDAYHQGEVAIIQLFDRTFDDKCGYSDQVREDYNGWNERCSGACYPCPFETYRGSPTIDFGA